MLAFFELLLIYASLALAQNTGQQTITALDAYSSLRACAQDCIWQSGLGCETDVLGATIGCANGDACFTPKVAAYNSCYCRADMQNTAMSYLSTCISNSCTEGAYTIDLSAAQSLYGGYCTAEGYTAVLAEATPANGVSAAGATATGTSSSGGNTVSGNGNTVNGNGNNVGSSGNQGGNSDQQCGTGANNSGTIECSKNGSVWSRTDFAALGAALVVAVLIISVVTICAIRTARREHGVTFLGVIGRWFNPLYWSGRRHVTDRDLSASEGFTQYQKFSTLPEVSYGRDLSKLPNSIELPAGPGIKELPAGPIQRNELP